MENRKNEIPIEQVLHMQFTKVGQLTFQIEILTQQLAAVNKENNELKEQILQLESN